MDLTNLHLKERALLYFAQFTAKNIGALNQMFSDDVWLQDWENFAEGKDEVLEVYQKIFAGVEQIAVTPCLLYEDRNTIIAELLISIDGKERIKVVDILQFDEVGRIKTVKAYKG